MLHIQPDIDMASETSKIQRGLTRPSDEDQPSDSEKVATARKGIRDEFVSALELHKMTKESEHAGKEYGGEISSDGGEAKGSGDIYPATLKPRLETLHPIEQSAYYKNQGPGEPEKETTKAPAPKDEDAPPKKRFRFSLAARTSDVSDMQLPAAPATPVIDLGESQESTISVEESQVDEDKTQPVESQ